MWPWPVEEIEGMGMMPLRSAYKVVGGRPVSCSAVLRNESCCVSTIAWSYAVGRGREMDRPARKKGPMSLRTKRS